MRKSAERSDSLFVSDPMMRPSLTSCSVAAGLPSLDHRHHGCPLGVSLCCPHLQPLLVQA